MLRNNLPCCIYVTVNLSVNSLVFADIFIDVMKIRTFVDGSVSGVSTHFDPLTRLCWSRILSAMVSSAGVWNTRNCCFSLFFNCYCYSSCGLLFFQLLELLELRNEAFGEGWDLNNAALDLDLN